MVSDTSGSAVLATDLLVKKKEEKETATIASTTEEAATIEAESAAFRALVAKFGFSLKHRSSDASSSGQKWGGVRVQEPRPRVAAGVELPCTSEVRVLVWRRPRNLKKKQNLWCYRFDGRRMT